jgi:hypothetical protein
MAGACIRVRGIAAAEGLTAPVLESLDYLYTPSGDVAADAAHLVEAGGRLVFAIESDGTRVAMVELGSRPPPIVLADHLEGDRPILVYRVSNLRAVEEALAGRSWAAEHRLEIPQGPVVTFRAPGGLRLAAYELVRPFVLEQLAGRRDF